MSKQERCIQWIRDVIEVHTDLANGKPLNDDSREAIEDAEYILEAINIADRLEKAEADVYNNYCDFCVSVEICKERDEICAEASYWIDGYNQALADVRGE